MGYKLFVGDVGEYLSTIAKAVDPTSSLLVSRQDINSGNTYYTSIPDMGELQDFVSVCTNAEHITYSPPEHWNNRPKEHTQQYWTEYLLTNISQKVPVDNLPDYKKAYASLMEPLDVRKSNNPQIWSVGCSITYGVGVEIHETWREKVGKKLTLPVSNLSKEGTSIIWAANQILQSDIRPGDYVLWGLTSNNRFLAVDSDVESVVHLNAVSFYEKDIKGKFPLEYIDSDTTIAHNINAIRNVYNFCKKMNAKLVIQSVMIDWDNLWQNYNVPCFEQTVTWPDNYLDLGTDNKHPGPKQHTYFAENFLKLIKRFYDKE